ncbi:hypothetical protein K0F68_14960, partial [Bacteroides fragilis]|nr:hypothetical protein [Bacteroides fragilis]
RKGSVKATYASDRPCLRVSAVYSGRREKGNSGQEMGRTGSKEYPKRQTTKDFREKGKAFSNKQAGI